MLKITNLSKSYAKGTKKAVDSLSLEIKNGEIFGFIGPNGAGKTTTIKMITGILIPDHGEIEINGHSLKNDPIAAKKSMGYVPDNHDIYEMLTGREYLSFMADMYGVPMRERKERIERYLKQFELDKAVDNQIKSYSHGMKQKLAIIGALVHTPRLLILDEPFVGLDPEAAFKLKNVFKEMCENGSAIFFSTHVLDVAEKLCNKIAIIKQGKLVACGPTEQVRGDESLETVFMEVLESNDK